MADLPPSTDDDIDADDLAQRAEAMRLDAAALNATIIEQMEADAARSRNERRRSNVVILVLSILVGALVYRSIFVTGPIITKLDTQQKDLTSLVDFVEEVKANESGGGGDNTKVFIDLLCASEDPVRIAHCESIGAYDP